MTTLSALLEIWRKTKDDGAAQVYRDACREKGIEPPLKSLAELKAQAAEQMKDAPQYNFDSYVLCRVKATTVTKMGRAFLGGEITIVNPTRTNPDPARYNVWSFANRIHTGLFDADIVLLSGNFAEESLAPPPPALKIELKKFSANERLSEETLAYHAEIHVGGKAVGTVSNHGTGGSSDVRIANEAMERKLVEFVGSLPPITTDMMDPHDPTKPFVYHHSLDSYLDSLAEKLQREKREKAARKKWARFAAKAQARGFLAFVTRYGQPHHYSEVLFEVKPASTPEKTLANAQAAAAVYASKKKQTVFLLEQVQP